MEVSTKQLAEKMDIDYPVAAALIKLIVKAGKGKELRKVPAAGGKGKPTTIYELPETVTITLDSRS